MPPLANPNMCGWTSAEQARRKGVRPIASADELRADVFDPDAQLDEFLADLETLRHEHMA